MTKPFQLTTKEAIDLLPLFGLVETAIGLSPTQRRLQDRLARHLQRSNIDSTAT